MSTYSHEIYEHFEVRNKAFELNEAIHRNLVLLRLDDTTLAFVLARWGMGPLDEYTRENLRTDLAQLRDELGKLTTVVRFREGNSEKVMFEADHWRHEAQLGVRHGE